MQWTEGFLDRKGIANPRRNTQDLMSYATGLSRLELYTNFDKPLSLEERDTLRDAVRRRADGEPLQYIIGRAPFRHLDIGVAPGVLIPRPETEGLVDIILDFLGDGAYSSSEPAIIADIGTGSGCIACSIASEFAESLVLACDVSAEALDIAGANRDELGLGSQVILFEGDCGEALPLDYMGRLDVVVSNPPYIPTAVLSALPDEVTAYEPALALDGGDDGLAMYRKLSAWAIRALRPGGLFACELFEERVDDAVAIALADGFDCAEVKNDLTERPRYAVAVKAVE